MHPPHPPPWIRHCDRSGPFGCEKIRGKLSASDENISDEAVLWVSQLRITGDSDEMRNLGTLLRPRRPDQCFATAGLCKHRQLIFDVSAEDNFFKHARILPIAPPTIRGFPVGVVNATFAS
jgi:hypothetical protein